jgi:hypothetical protein
MVSKEEFEVLNCVDIKHRVKDMKTILPRTRLSEDEVKSVLKKLEKAKLVASKDGWEVTKKGQTEAKSYRSQKYKKNKAAISKMYTDEFLKLDKVLKTIITDWQLKTIGGKMVPNDHKDQAYDRAVMDRLYSFHENEAKKLYKRLEEMIPHLNYSGMFDVAIAKVKSGDYTYLSRPDIDSYHNVWFELHEDILRSADIERVE